MSSSGTGLSGIWSRFFCEKTHLFYDYLADGKELTGELPTPEEIRIRMDERIEELADAFLKKL